MINEIGHPMPSWSFRIPTALLVAAFTAYAVPAHSQHAIEARSAEETAARRGTPQGLGFEVRLGQYRPDVDSEFNGKAHPYRDAFGDRSRFLVGLELDWQLLRIPKFGTLGPGVGWGYTSASAIAPFTDGSNGSGEETTFKVMPTYLVGVLRFDYLALNTRIPLGAYVKAGFGYALWWTSTSGETENVNNKVGRGRSLGYNFALGGQFLLNWLDQSSAAEMSYSHGVNRVYLFAEWYKSNLDGFGGGLMQVGTSTWMAGLLFDI